VFVDVVIVLVFFGRGGEGLVIVVADETRVITGWEGNAFAAPGSRAHT